MKKIEKDNYTKMLWKNGGGTTYEIVRFPEIGEKFYYRISMAIINQDGPFSEFPGVDRHLKIISGNGCHLVSSTREVRLNIESPILKFPGEEIFSSQLLDGPITDFNVMIDREWGEATVSEVERISLENGTDTKFYFSLKDFSTEQDPTELPIGKYIEIKIKKAR